MRKNSLENLEGRAHDWGDNLIVGSVLMVITLPITSQVIHFRYEDYAIILASSLAFMVAGIAAKVIFKKGSSDKAWPEEWQEGHTLELPLSFNEYSHHTSGPKVKILEIGKEVIRVRVGFSDFLNQNLSRIIDYETSDIHISNASGIENVTIEEEKYQRYYQQQLDEYRAEIVNNSPEYRSLRDKYNHLITKLTPEELEQLDEEMKPFHENKD